MADRESEWFDQFFTRIDTGMDDRLSAVRLIGELLDEGVIYREGDSVYGRGGKCIDLNASDQYLVRRIEDAADAARKAIEEESDA